MNNLELTNKAKELLEIETVFVWGAMGERITMTTINNAIRIAPRRYTPEIIERLKRMIGKDIYCFDCIGVLRWCTKNNEQISTDELFEKGVDGGDIDSLPNIPGILVYMPNHIGIYIGNSEVIESTYAVGVGYGVTKTKVKDRNWTHWFKSHWINYTEE